VLLLQLLLLLLLLAWMPTWCLLSNHQQTMYYPF
jgi:hypothetical protein